MSKITKNQRIETLERQVAGLTTMLTMLQVWSDHADKALNELSPIVPESQLKQLDQSIFDGLDEKWQWAAVDSDGDVYAYLRKPINDHTGFYLAANERNYIGGNYDASNWRNSLIKRDDIAKKLAEVDLSIDLTGGELCKAMLTRGDKHVMCLTDDGVDVIHDLGCFISSTHPYIGHWNNYRRVTPINNQGEPLTASEVGL